MEKKIESAAEERKNFRQANYRTEIKTADISSFKIIAPGNDDDDPARNLAALESIRRIVYPELARGLRVDRTIVKIIRGGENK